MKCNVFDVLHQIHTYIVKRKFLVSATMNEDMVKAKG